MTQASTSSAEQVDYMLIIRNSTGNAQQGYSTTGNYFESFGTAYTEENEIHPGTNQDDSAFIAFGYTVSGNFVKSTGAWFAFRTEEEEKTATFSFRVENGMILY